LIESDGICAIVLEYVEGESLRMRLDRHPMTIEEAIRTATLICEGLKQAHDKGIVHRDLKPSNIILTREKGLKILDFGLAKLENSLTSSEETQAGTILGTTAYMSPEQTRGESASSSSDLWGLGCILFEMLTATHPFKASNTADTIANVLKSSPSWESLPPGIPSPTLYLMRQCLLGDPESRLHSASAGHSLLLASLESFKIPINRSETQIPASRSNTFRIFGLGLICSIVGLLVGILFTRPNPGPDLVTDEGNTLYAHSIETNTRMAVVELPGPVIPNHGGGAWLPNNTIRFNTGDEGIKEITLHQHATLRSILDITDADDNFHDASALPHGRGLLFATHHRNGGIDSLSVWTPETQRKDIFKLPGRILGYPVYSNLGYILFCSYLPQSNMQFSKIWAFPFDLETLEKTGPKFLLDEKGGFSLTMSENNTLVYKLPPKKPRRHQLAWLGGSVEEAQYPERGFVRDVIMSLAISPNQSKVAFSTADANSNQLWVHNFESSTSHLLQTSSSVSSLSSILWKNEDHLVYHTWDADGVFTWEDDLRRSTPPRKISRGCSIDISNDGRKLLAQGLPRWGRHSIINLDDPESEIERLPENLNDVWAPKFSPSQKFIAFVAGEERKDSSIYLTDYPDGRIRFLVNKELPGKQPFWHPSKDLLYFIHTKENQNEIYSVTVDTMPDVQLSNPKLEGVLPKSTYLGTQYNPHIMAYHEEKKRFLFIEDQTPDDGEEKVRGNALITLNWRPRVLFTNPDVTEEQIPGSSL
jgi:serine/threonine protein kinase